jgi:S-adenosylmethionine-dependent methyltransferase
MSSINDYYNILYDEWSRLDRHRLELEITKRVLDEYIPEKADVLDVGGGPGRYSIYLAQKGHSVTLFDLSENHIRQAAVNAEKYGVTLKQMICGNALELDMHLPDRYYDVVLCMGPMYHLLEEAERKEAVRQCLARLKPGGILIVSFISVFAPIYDLMGRSPAEISESKSWLLSNFADGRNSDVTGFTQAYFIDPADILPFMSQFNIRKLRLIAQEGLGLPYEGALMQLPEDKFRDWIDLLYTIADHEAVYGACGHLLYIGRKGE